jgi:hypothetical protein
VSSLLSFRGDIGRRRDPQGATYRCGRSPAATSRLRSLKLWKARESRIRNAKVRGRSPSAPPTVGQKKSKYFRPLSDAGYESMSP